VPSKELVDQQKAFARWSVLTPAERAEAGLAPSENQYAKRLGKHRNTIAYWKESDVFKAEVKRAEAERGRDKTQEEQGEKLLDQLASGSADVSDMYPHIKAKMVRRVLEGGANAAEINVVRDLWLRDLAQAEAAELEADLGDRTTEEIEAETLALVSDDSLAAEVSRRQLDLT